MFMAWECCSWVWATRVDVLYSFRRQCRLWLGLTQQILLNFSSVCKPSYPQVCINYMSWTFLKRQCTTSFFFLLSFPLGGGDREALSGVIRPRLQVQYHPQLQWRSVRPLPPANSFPGVWMHGYRERQVPLYYLVSSSLSDTKSSPLSYQLSSCLFVWLL